MKKHLILHIGLPKTGTTYLQCQIQTNRDKLRGNGIFVPKIGQLVGRDHNLLALALQPERWDQFPVDVSASLPSMWCEFLEEIDNCDCQTILVTSEAFSWELKTPDQIKSVRDYLINYDVTIVLCEREPYEFISSMYGQMLRTGRGPYSLESFLLEFPYYWSAASQKKRWGDFFGENNVLLLSYEELKGEYILPKFLNALFPSHPVLSETFNASPDVNPNLSFSPRFLRFMEELSANRIDATPYVNLFSKVLSTIVPLERKILTPVEIDDAMKGCGMELDPSNSTANKILHQPDREEEKVPLLEQISDELIAKTKELVETNQLLIMEKIDEIKGILNQNLNRSIITEERTITLESLVHIADERSQAIEYLARLAIFAGQHQIDQLQKLYVESMPAALSLNQHAAFNASRIIKLETDYPIAVDSYDYISPDSTAQGSTRPTFFVQDCIRVLGQNIKCLDLGSGAAGLVFEYAKNQVLAIGVDGSDFCRINRVGYWPLLPNNLFTCDITKPFNFVSRDTQAVVNFDVITMWEVLEHIAEQDLAGLFDNVRRHLDERGYFMGSISLLEYVDDTGSPYHVTLKPREWWKAKLIESGLVLLDEHPFNEKFFCRGNGPRFEDFHNYAVHPEKGFWFVAQRRYESEHIST